MPGRKRKRDTNTINKRGRVHVRINLRADDGRAVPGNVYRSLTIHGMTVTNAARKIKAALFETP